MGKKVTGCRVEDVPVGEFRPLDDSDIRTIRRVIIGEGGKVIDRGLLGRLVLDRERLAFVVCCAEEWRTILDYAAKLEKGLAGSVDPDTTARLVAEARSRAEYLLRHALKQREGAGVRSVSAKIHRLVISFSARQTRRHERRVLR